MRTAVVALGLAVLLSPVPAAQTDSYTRAREVSRARLVDIVSRQLTPGVSAAVVMGGRVVWSDAAGFADLEHRVPVSRETRFGLGSISKTLTMAAAMRLMDEGVLDLDAPIERYLPDFPHRGRGITVRRIAVHQSGLSDAFSTALYETTRRFDTVHEAYQGVKTDQIVYAPGTESRYATGTYTIIARVLEAVAQQPYTEVMRSRVFEPLGLTSIVPNDRRAIIPDRSGFYVRTDAGRFEHAPYTDWSHKLAGAGWAATAEDIATFGAALARGPFLSDRARREMFTAVPLTTGAPTQFALGLRVGEHRGRRMLHLPGGGLGISTWLFVYPEEQLSIALLSNVPTGPVGGRTHEIIAGAFLDARNH